MEHIYDVIIIGGGPAGYSAALYATRAGLDTIVLERLSAGGQMALTLDIDNYPGFDEGIDGFTLGQKMQQGAERFGSKSAMADVYSAQLSGEIKVLETSEGTFKGKSVIIATGAETRKLGIGREDELTGRGIHYCATCDGMGYRGKTVAVIGGGNTAVEDALILARLSEKVILVHRRDSLRADKVYHDQLMKTENIELRWNSVISELVAEEKFQGIKVKDVNSSEESFIPCDGVFVSIGRVPETKKFADEIKLDSQGYIVADETTRTNIPGVFAAGDVRTKALRQVITAAADGAVAAYFADEYLGGL